MRKQRDKRAECRDYATAILQEWGWRVERIGDDIPSLRAERPERYEDRIVVYCGDGPDPLLSELERLVNAALSLSTFPIYAWLDAGVKFAQVAMVPYRHDYDERRNWYILQDARLRDWSPRPLPPPWEGPLPWEG